MNVTRSRLVVGGCAMAVAATAWIGVQGQEDPLAGGVRRLMQDTGLPAIDRGFRAQDIPGDPAHHLGAPEPIDRASTASAASLPDSVIVKFKGGADRSAAVNSTLSQLAGGSAEQPSWADFEVLTIGTGVDPEAAAAALAARSDVEYAQPRYRNHAMFKPNDPLYSNQWNFPAIDMERAWDIQPGAGQRRHRRRARHRRGLQVGDLPLQLALCLPPDARRSGLPGARRGGRALCRGAGAGAGSSRFVAPRDFIWDDNDPVDLDGHGTHVSGTIGQVTNNSVGVAGMAFNVRIMPVKVIAETWDDIFGSPNGGTDDVVARGMRYAADNGAKVINMSIGRMPAGPPRSVEDAIRYAVGKGVFVADRRWQREETGNQPNVIAEHRAAHRRRRRGRRGRPRRSRRAYYSTTGAVGGDLPPRAAIRGRRRRLRAACCSRRSIAICSRPTTGPASQYGPPRFDAFAYYYFQGTSMATPHVSGFAALLIQQGITSPAAIEAAMKQFATDKGAAGRDDEYGVRAHQPSRHAAGAGPGPLEPRTI